MATDGHDGPSVGVRPVIGKRVAARSSGPRLRQREHDQPLVAARRLA